MYFATLCHTPFLGPVNIWISKIFSSMQFVSCCWEENMNLYWELKFQYPCVSDLWVTDPSFCTLTFQTVILGDGCGYWEQKIMLKVQMKRVSNNEVRI